MLSILHSAFLVLVLSGFAAAQIDTGEIPQACQSPCKKLLDLENTCVVEYPQQGTKPTATACLCNGLSGLDYSSCTTCLNANSPALAQSVSQLSGFCTQFINGCVYECSFDTCPSSNVPCQCKETYLQDIYNCAFCNSGLGNINATTLTDYTGKSTGFSSRPSIDVPIALSNSCSNQGQTATPTGADPVPTPSGTIAYTGGGISLPNLSSGSYSTHASSGTTTHASTYTTAMTSGTNTGTTSAVTATSLIATPSSLTGESGKIKSSLNFGGWMCLITFGSMLMAFRELV